MAEKEKEINSEKKKQKKLKFTKGMKTGVRVLIIITVFTILVLMAADRFNIASITDINDSIKSLAAGINPGPGYPYKINSGNVKGITVLGGDLYILEATETMSIDSTAKVIKHASHTYSNPAMASRGSKAIVYNRSGNRFRVENRTDTLFEGKTEDDEKIITVAIGAKGNIALATFSDDCSSRLIVYGSTYKKIVFAWNCVQDTITSVDLSDNGRLAAVTVVGARNGEIFSKLFVFDFQYSEPLTELEYPGTAMVGVHFARNDNIAAIGDNMTVLLKSLKNEERIEYGSSTLSNFEFSDDGYTVLVLSEHGSTNNEVVCGYTPGLSKSFEKKFDRSVKSITMNNNHIALLFDNEAVVLKSGGGVYKRYDADNTAFSAFNLGNRTYLYCSGEIKRVK